MESKELKEILHNMKEDVIYHFGRFTIEKHHNKFIFRNFLDNKHDFNDYVTKKDENSAVKFFLKCQNNFD
ncbi:hypothetical protein [Thomasclavelia ramosa]|uniref:Uncharacterized protein n=1 Tax=Thomasclavelia ramosa TaxID=1547 RepID=A0A3E3E4U8_9FIRM|nr:hypothetical protein [Thomasclavelia ramosa]RGD76219.1 hypothetical protein DXB93_18985 [Thomasclavelia ramosa]